MEIGIVGGHASHAASQGISCEAWKKNRCVSVQSDVESDGVLLMVGSDFQLDTQL